MTSTLRVCVYVCAYVHVCWGWKARAGPLSWASVLWSSPLAYLSFGEPHSPREHLASGFPMRRATVPWPPLSPCSVALPAAWAAPSQSISRGNPSSDRGWHYGPCKKIYLFSEITNRHFGAEWVLSESKFPLAERHFWSSVHASGDLQGPTRSCSGRKGSGTQITGQVLNERKAHTWSTSGSNQPRSDQSLSLLVSY